MTTLDKTLLATLPWRLLMIIGRQRDLRLPSNTPKADLVERLAQVLLDPANLSQALADLAEPEQRALSEILAAGGRLPLRYLKPRHGGLRSVKWMYRWFSQATERPRDDGAAPSPLERLRALGLVFYDSQTEDVFIPLELRPHLPEPALPPPPPERQPGAGAHPAPAPIDLLCNDLAALLALLQRDDVRPLAGGWLPPGFLAAWGQHCAVPPASPQARSELQTERRRLLHYLAEAAGLVASCGLFLKPAPAAWPWLRAARAERLQALWEAWSTPDPDRWRAFRLPGAGWLACPATLIAAIHAGLDEMEASDPQAFAQALVARQPELRDLVPPGSFDGDELLVETIVEILGSREYGVGSIECESDLVFGKFAVSADLQSNPLDSKLIFTLTEGLPEPAHLAVAIEVGSMEYGVGEQPLTPYSLLPTTFIHALHQGWSAPALLDALDELAERPLTGQERALLRGWAEAAERVRISRPTLLETSDPGVISRLASARRGRSLFVRTLSPRAIVVDAGRLDQLVRRVTRQESVPPRLSGGVREQGSEGAGGRGREHSCSPAPPLPHTPKLPHSHTLARGGAAHAWLALRVYQGLGEHVRLPARTPQALLDHLAALADPADLSAAETAAEATLEALQSAMVGRVSFPPWPEDGLPVAESLAVIEAALAEGLAVEMDYYTAGRDARTRRVVEPYRLEWRGDVPYLVGFCYRVQSERIFRLDRIYSVVKVLEGVRSRE
jgi:hypothetical protein